MLFVDPKPFPRYHRFMNDATPPADPARRFSHVETWIFDLDNTLYPASDKLFSQIEDRITRYLMRELGVSQAEAARLRREYWHDHGTTLAGLMLHHAAPPDPFLEEVHEIDFSVLAPDRALRAAIEALPGRKIVYTNGTAPYARRVVRALGLEDCFERIYGVEDAFYTPKPNPAAYRRIFGADGLDPRRAAMFEDDPRNLETPHALGVVTVLVGADARPEPGRIDFATDDLAGFLSRLRPASLPVGPRALGSAT